MDGCEHVFQEAQNMDKNQQTDNNSPNPTNFDSEQLKELEKLIDSLKKEIVFPGKKVLEKRVFSKTRQN